jgi:hypothetical protein
MGGGTQLERVEQVGEAGHLHMRWIYALINALDICVGLMRWINAFGLMRWINALDICVD